jgi:hypothetical protein
MRKPKYFKTLEAPMLEAMSFIAKGEVVPEELQDRICAIFEKHAVVRKYLKPSELTQLRRRLIAEMEEEAAKQGELFDAPSIEASIPNYLDPYDQWDEENRYWYEVKPEWMNAVKALAVSRDWKVFTFVGIKIEVVDGRLKGSAPDPDGCYAIGMNHVNEAIDGAVFLIKHPDYSTAPKIELPLHVVPGKRERLHTTVLRALRPST